jgi:hypothetical protein
MLLPKNKTQNRLLHSQVSAQKFSFHSHSLTLLPLPPLMIIMLNDSLKTPPLHHLLVVGEFFVLLSFLECKGKMANFVLSINAMAHYYLQSINDLGSLFMTQLSCNDLGRVG